MHCSGPRVEKPSATKHWMVQGFVQLERLNNDEVFVSVVAPVSYKAILALSPTMD